MTNEEIREAIMLLAEYCGSRTCRGCKLHIDHAGCLLSCGYPYQWAENMKECGMEAENDN